jgi:hypothetical protein
VPIKPVLTSLIGDKTASFEAGKRALQRQAIGLRQQRETENVA